MIAFDDLITSLPVFDVLPQLLQGPEVTHVRHIAEVNQRFVAPLFREERAITPGQTSVILLSAPAAVGKSTVASEIACRVHAPLLDLSQFQVGDGFVEGTITKAYGRRQLAPILDAVEDGTMALVFDALDEGEVRAGSNNFEAFILDLCSLCEQPRPKPTIVVLARGETAALVELYFEDRGVPYASYVLDFFDEPAARQFLNLWLDDVNKRLPQRDQALHRQYRVKFNEAVDLLFEVLANAVAGDSPDASWDNSGVRSFLGYAPVLVALAEYLRVRNYNSICQTLREAPAWLGADQSAWHILSTIVQSLIDREQQKVIDNVRPRLSVAADTLSFSEWGSLYGIDEQMIRVLARTLSLTIHDPLPRLMPGQLRDPYEDAVGLMLPQHPFLSDGGFTSVVFQEFLYARTLQFGPAWLREALRQHLRESDHLPSHLLAYFMMESKTAQSPVIHAPDVSIVLNSLQSGATRPGEIQVAITDIADANIVGLAWRGETTEHGVYFEVDEIEAGITFWRRLAYCVVNAPSTRIQLSADQEFRFGPEAYVEAASLEIRASEFRVDTGQAFDTFGTVLVADAFSDASTVTRVRVFGKNDFLIYWPRPIYPWIDYQAQRETGAPYDSLINDAYRHLRRILRGFRGSASVAGIGRGAQYINQVAVGSGQLPNSLLDYLISTGLIQRQGSRYVLDTEKAGSLGLSFENLRGATIPDLVQPYLEQFSKEYRKA